MLNRNASGTENIKITKANRKTRKRKEEKKANRKTRKRKEEKKAYKKAYRETHKEEIKAYGKAYYEDHKEEIKAYGKAYYEDHKEEKKAYHKDYYEDNKEERKANRKAYRETHKEKIKAYRETHKEEIRANQKAYRETHKEEIKANSKAYYEAHKEEKKAYEANKRKRGTLEASEPASKRQKRGINANTVGHANTSEQQRTTPFNEKTELDMRDAILESIQQMEARGYFDYLNLDDRNTQQQNYFTNNRSSFSGNLQSDVNLTAQVSNVSDQQVNPGYSSSELLFGNIAPIHQQQIVDPPVEDNREVVTGFSLSTTNNNYYRKTITSKQLLFGSNVRATNLAAANTHQASVEQAPLFTQEQSDDAFIDSFFNNSPTGS